MRLLRLEGIDRLPGGICSIIDDFATFSSDRIFRVSTPEDDPLLSRKWGIWCKHWQGVNGLYFAFASKRQLIAGVDPAIVPLLKKLRIAGEFAVVVAEYDVDESEVVFGTGQVVFDKDHGKRVSTTLAKDYDWIAP